MRCIAGLTYSLGPCPKEFVAIMYPIRVLGLKRDSYQAVVFSLLQIYDRQSISSMSQPPLQACLVLWWQTRMLSELHKLFFCERILVKH